MKVFLSFFIFVSVTFANLIPTPLFTDPESMQRIGWEATMEHLEEANLFSQNNGISFVKLRVDFPETFLGVISDQTWDRLIYLVGIDSLGDRYMRFTKAYGDWQSSSYFRSPRGVTCDSTVFNSRPDSYFVYIADSYNDRIVRCYYDANTDTMLFYDNMLSDSLSHPEDVACVSISSGGSYMIIADTDNHRFRIVKINSNLTYSIEKTYGSEGSGTGQFKYPTSVAMVACPDSSNYYRIYIVDQYNFRIVSLLYNSSTNSVSWERVYTDATKTVGFQAVTSNPYYCVYVTDGA